MKRILILVVIFSVGVMNVKASEADFRTVGEKLKARVSIVNSKSECYNSSVVIEDKEIKITYGLKSDSSSACKNISWFFKLIYDSDADGLKFVSYSHGMVIKEDYKNYFIMDNLWIKELVNILGISGELKPISYTDKYVSKKDTFRYEETVCGDGNQACSLEQRSLEYYFMFDYMFKDLYTVSDVTDNSLKIKFNRISNSSDVCAKFKRSEDNVNYVNVQEEPDCQYEITDNNLKPNTTYYYKLVDEVMVEVKTLASQSDVPPIVTDKPEKDDKLSKDEEIKNPNTGDKTVLLFGFLILSLGLVGYRVKRY